MPSYFVGQGRRCENATSRLTNSLIRLRRHMVSTRDRVEKMDETFEKWQQIVTRKRSQIARRLEIIERQLESLDGTANVGIFPQEQSLNSFPADRFRVEGPVVAGKKTNVSPRLSLFTESHDSGSVTATQAESQ